MTSLNLCFSSPGLLFLVFAISNVDNELLFHLFRSLKVAEIHMICGSRICCSKVVLKLAYFNVPNCRTGKEQLEECDIHTGCSLLKKGEGEEITRVDHIAHCRIPMPYWGKIRKSSVNMRARSEKNQRM